MTRKWVPLIAILVALTLGLVGCGQSEDRGEAQETETPAGSEGAFPVTVQHKLGTITIPSRPERVVSIGYKEQDWPYEFGVSPVAVRKWYGHYDGEINPWAADHVQGTPPEVLGDEFNFERIAALQPDLIVGVYSGITQEDYQRLSKIAPTLAGPVGSIDYNEPWRDMTRLIGTSLGQAERAEAIITDIEGRGGGLEPDSPTPFAQLGKVAPVLPTDQTPWREDLEQFADWLGRSDRLAETLGEHERLIADLKAEHAVRLASAKVAFGSIEDPGLWLANLEASTPASSALADLGGSPMPFTEGKDFPGWLGLSLENLMMLAKADALLFWAPDQANIEALEKNPLWRNLPAVKAGRTVMTTNNVGHGSVYTVMETARIWDQVYATLG